VTHDKQPRPIEATDVDKVESILEKYKVTNFAEILPSMNSSQADDGSIGLLLINRQPIKA
jgi:hypothetical protein